VTSDPELLAFCRGAPARRAGRELRQGRIAFDAARHMLLADLPLAELAQNVRTERRAGAPLHAIDERATTKAILRRWAAMTQSDPYVSDALGRAAGAFERYSAFLADFQSGLDGIRIDYEIKKHAADRLAFHFDGERAVVRAENHWESVREAFPEEAGRLVEQFRGLRRAGQELTAVREELNTELRAFMASFVGCYLTYARRQSRERRRRLGLGGRGLRRLASYLLAEIENTDFLLVDGGGLEIPLPRIPREIAAFAKTDAYRRHENAVQKGKVQETEDQTSEERG
jgi:hypothetical protein